MTPKPCGVCGGPQSVTLGGKRYCVPCGRRRARARRERLRALGMDPHARLPDTPAAWCRALEADPNLYERVRMEARCLEEPAEPDWRERLRRQRPMPRVYRVSRVSA